MELRIIRKITIFLMSVCMSAAFCQQQVNEEAHRLTAGWKFVLANQTLFSRGSLIEDPVILYVYDVDEFEELDVDEDVVKIRVLKRENSNRPVWFGFLDLNRNTYDVIGHQDPDEFDLDEWRGKDVLIGIESSVPWESAGSAERFILETTEPETASESEESG